ncbi:MAG TPA: D-aminoacyl-tRNA deacylase [Candidatus Acidoferrum sp.]|nr:D-aminoacyl-tRNA deacylase [Candidatus Acidoferrum sp.]
MQNRGAARHCGGTEQLFLPALPAGAAGVCGSAVAAANRPGAFAEAVADRLTSMRAVLQRVSRAKVTVEGRVTGEIGPGLMILLAVGRSDSSSVVARMAERCANLRIFEDDRGKMNLSLLEVKGSALAVSQFTLYGDARGQRRPSFITAAPPELAKALYDEFCEALRQLGVTVATGIFQAMMSVELVNEGPVTILLDSDNAF